jgi:putative ABC transport system permease protein
LQVGEHGPDAAVVVGVGRKVQFRQQAADVLCHRGLRDDERAGDRRVGPGLEPAGFTVAVQPLAPAAAYATGIVVALAGVWSVARRAARTSPLDALREAAAEKRAMTPARRLAGLLGVAGGLALLAAVPSLPVDARSTAGLGAAMLLLTAAALLAPVLIVPLVRAVTWPWRRRRPACWCARAR